LIGTVGRVADITRIGLPPVG